MSTTLTVRFVLGRYHATPWGRHVNEGQVELPPSPWRLLRALYAVWQGRRPELDSATVRTLLTRLAEPPIWFVPPHTLGHSRHWLPDSRHRTAGSSTALTIDAYAAIDPGQVLAARWPFDLPPEEAKALATLAEALPYLGRAESVCEAALEPAWNPADHPDHAVWTPLDVSEAPDRRAPATTVLAPTLPLDLDALLQRPVDVRAGLLLFPPATRFVGYAVAARSAPAAPLPARRPVQAFRFTVTNRVRPPETDAVVVADLVRQAALGRLGRRTDQLDSRLAGRDAGGEQLRDQHTHAHFLALPDPERRVSEVVIWSPAGFDEFEANAIGSLREVRTRIPNVLAPNPLTVRLAACGDTGDVLDDLCGPARVWRSATPFLPPRRGKGDWARFVGAEVNRELGYRRKPAAAVTIESDRDWREFVRYRPTRRFAATDPDRRSARRGSHLWLTFGEAVRGPLALGHLSHFGLGLFLPA